LLEQKYKTENDRINHSEQRAINAEQQVLITEKQVWKMREELKVSFSFILLKLKNNIFIGKTTRTLSNCTRSSKSNSKTYKRKS